MGLALEKRAVRSSVKSNCRIGWEIRGEIYDFDQS